MWIENDKLNKYLRDLSKEDINSIDIICVSMTAELSDAYGTKVEGVLDISKRSIDCSCC